MRVLVIVISCKMYFLCVSLFHQPFVTLNLVYTTVSTYTSTLLVALLPTESSSYRAISQLHNWWKSISVQYDLSLCLSEKRYIYQSVTKPDSWVTDSQIHYSHLITGLKTYHQVSSIAQCAHVRHEPTFYGLAPASLLEQIIGSTPLEKARFFIHVSPTDKYIFPVFSVFFSQNKQPKRGAIELGSTCLYPCRWNWSAKVYKTIPKKVL